MLLWLASTRDPRGHRLSRKSPDRKGLSGRGATDSKRVLKPDSGSAMWTATTRRQHSRDRLRYETDLTDAEWALLKPLMPEPRQRGRPRAWPLREIVNAIFSVL